MGVLQVLCQVSFELSDRLAMLLDHFWQFLDVSCDRSSGEGGGRNNHINQSTDALIGSITLGNVIDLLEQVSHLSPQKEIQNAYHQGPRVKTGLVFRTVVVLPSKLQNSSIIPPQKARNHDIKEPCTDGHSIIRYIERVDGGNLADRSLTCELLSVDQVNRNQYAASNSRHHQEYIPAHPQDSHKYHRVQPNQSNKILLCRLEHRSDPGKNASSHRWRSMFVICDFELRGIYDGIIGSK